MTGNPDNEIDTLQWKAVDSFGNEDITTMNVALTNDAPVIEGPTTFSANQHEAIESGSLFIASDPEGDALTYWVADKAPFQYGGGHFVIDGVAIEDTNGWLEVGTDPSKIVWMTGHPADGDEVFKIMAKDSHGNLSNIIEVTNVVNRPPTISASQLTLEADAYGTIDISSIFTASDIDGDAIQRIWVKTSSDAAYISRSTTSHQVDADDWESIQPQFDNLTYTAGNPPGIKNADNTWSKGTETLWVRVTDINGATSNEIELTVTVNNDALFPTARQRFTSMKAGPSTCFQCSCRATRKAIIFILDCRQFKRSQRQRLPHDQWNLQRSRQRLDQGRREPHGVDMACQRRNYRHGSGVHFPGCG